MYYRIYISTPTVFIEKILRATDVKCIYILMRPKKGQTVEERIEAMFKNPVSKYKIMYCRDK